MLIFQLLGCRRAHVAGAVSPGDLLTEVRLSDVGLDLGNPARNDCPLVDGSRLTMPWRVTYEKAGIPDLVISGTETAEFEGDRISRLKDVFDPEAQKTTGEWLAAHGTSLEG